MFIYFFSLCDLLSVSDAVSAPASARSAARPFGMLTLDLKLALETVPLLLAAPFDRLFQLSAIHAT